MKTTIFKISFIFLLFSLIGAGCDKDKERNLLCYQGKVVSLNQGNGCQNIIRITKSAKDGALEVGITITFNPDLYEGTLKVGDVAYFKINQYEEWEGPATADCLWPQFIAQIEFCNN